jgi:putative nucleotidyltransferase with HDIG domain
MLCDSLPRRWTHTRGVASRARGLASILGEDAALSESAAWLHDIGYAETIAHVGFHPIDGARFLRDETDADEMICRLVAHHTGAEVEAEVRGLPAIASEFQPPPNGLLEPLTYCDMSSSVDGQVVDIEQRLGEILERYPTEHVVHRSIQSPRRFYARHLIRRRIACSELTPPDRSVEIR